MTPDTLSPTPRRINVRGCSGSGKTTFAVELASRLGLPHIELDALYHGPNWSEPAPEVFRDRVKAMISAHPEGWVIDGSYDSKLGRIVLAASDTIVWLDPPLPVVYSRLWRRTLYRVMHKVELWNGNRETWRDQFASRQSLLISTLRSHIRHRRNWPATFANDPRVVRLRSREDARRWLDDLDGRA